MFATAVAVALIESSEKSSLPSLVVLLRKNGRLPDCAFPPNCEAVPLLRASATEQASRLRSDSCVNKACCAS